MLLEVNLICEVYLQVLWEEKLSSFCIYAIQCVFLRENLICEENSSRKMVSYFEIVII